MGGETTALARTENGLAQNGGGGAAPVRYTDEERKIIRDQYARDFSELEFDFVIATCRHRGLDIFRGDAHVFKQGGKVTITPSFEGMIARALETGDFQGIDGPFWCGEGEDSEWRDVWLPGKLLGACKVAVYRRGCPRPFWGVAVFREYNRPNMDPWKQRPAHMLSIKALRNALKMAGLDRSAGGGDGDELTVIDEATGEMLQPASPALAPKPAKPAAAAKRPSNDDAAQMRAANDQLASAFRGASVDPKDVDLVSRIVLAGLNRPLDDARSLTAADRERLAKWTLANADAVSGILVDLQREREAAAASAESPFEDGGAEEAAYEPDAGDLKLTGAQERAREAVRGAETGGTYAQQQGL